MINRRLSNNEANVKKWSGWGWRNVLQSWFKRHVGLLQLDTAQHRRQLVSTNAVIMIQNAVCCGQANRADRSLLHPFWGKCIALAARFLSTPCGARHVQDTALPGTAISIWRISAGTTWFQSPTLVIYTFALCRCVCVRVVCCCRAAGASWVYVWRIQTCYHSWIWHDTTRALSVCYRHICVTDHWGCGVKWLFCFVFMRRVYIECSDVTKFDSVSVAAVLWGKFIL